MTAVPVSIKGKLFLKNGRISARQTFILEEE